MKKTFIFTLLASAIITAVFFGCKKSESNDNGGGDTPTPAVEQVKTPTFTIPTDTVYTEAISVEILCETEASSIYYTLDGSDPDSTSNSYQNSIEIDATTTIKARAYKSGLTCSSIASATYTFNSSITVANPTFTPVGGTYNAPVSVNVSCSTDGAAVYYTVNGDEPDETSTQYSSPIEIRSNTTLKAKAFKDGYFSETSTAEYIIDLVNPTVATPVFTPDGGHYDEAQYVAVTCDTEEAKIYYTVDGSNPTPLSIEYTNPIHIVKKYTKLKAKAYKRGYKESEIKEDEYYLDVVCNGTFTTSDDGKPKEIVSCVKSLNPFTGKLMLRFETGDTEYYMTIAFDGNEIQPGVYAFQTQCTGSVTIKGNPYEFIDGDLNISIESDIYTLTFDEVPASHNASRPITVSLDFKGNILE